MNLSVTVMPTELRVRFKPVGEQGVPEIDVVALPAAAGGATVGAPQRFKLEDAWSPSGDFQLQAIDVNFDGVLDLSFGAILGTPNLTLNYWTVDARGIAFQA